PPRRSAAPMKPRTRAPTRIGMRMRSQRHERFCGSSSTCCGVVSIANSGLPHDLQKRRVDSFSVPHAEQMTPLGATSRASSSGGLTISISDRYGSRPAHCLPADPAAAWLPEVPAGSHAPDVDPAEAFRDALPEASSVVAAAGDPCDATAELCHVLEVGGGAGAGSEAVGAGEDPVGGVSHVEGRDAGSSLAGSPETAVPGDDPAAPGVGGPGFAGGRCGWGCVG